jgi:hypothetical protein
MVLILPYIHQIALKRGADALLIMFRNNDGDPNVEEIRRPMIIWLEKRGISWAPCMGFYRKGVVDESYTGGISIDVPFDLDDQNCAALIDLLDNDDPMIQLSVCTLKEAVQDFYSYKKMLAAL